jgi:hypothetical protein
MPTHRDKYPRTWHLQMSPGQHRDDRQHASDDHLTGLEVVICEKLDGSGVSLHADGLYARSKNGPPNHPSYAPLKALHATISWQLPDHLSLFGEWLHTIHSIHYPQLPAAAELQLFAVRDDRDRTWWSWDDLTDLASQLGLTTTPVLHRGVFTTVDELHATVLELAGGPSTYGPDIEGVVVRTAAGFHDDEFTWRVSKWVREGHVAGQRWERYGIRRHQTDAGDLP